MAEGERAFLGSHSLAHIYLDPCSDNEVLFELWNKYSTRGSKCPSCGADL